MGADQITGVRDPVLAKVTNWKYQGFDLSTPDVDRAQVFLQEFSGYEKSGTDAGADRDAPPQRSHLGD